MLGVLDGGPPQGPGTLSAFLGFVKGGSGGATMPPHQMSQKLPLTKCFFMGHELFHVSLKTPFIDEETERQRCSMPCLRSHRCDR